MIRKIHVYDLDGTVISSSHRYRTLPGEMRIDLKYWRENDIPEKIAKDSLLPHAAQYKSDLANPEILVIIATARACVPGDANWQFVEKRLGLPDFFIHRDGPNDTRKGAKLKIEGLLPIIAKFPNAVIHFWEDNADYLCEVSQAVGAVPHFVPSTQGY